MEPQQLLDALDSACNVEPRGHVTPHVRPGTTLGDWLTIEPPARKTVTALRRQVLALLRELPEDLTVAELRDALEEI